MSPCGAGQLPRRPQRTPFAHDSRRIRAARRLKRQCQQCVAGQNGGRLSVYLMAGSASTAHVVVVHAGKIVVDKGIGVNHFERAGPRQSILRRSSAQAAELHQQERTDPFSSRQQAVAHGVNHLGVKLSCHGRKNAIQRKLQLLSVLLLPLCPTHTSSSSGSVKLRIFCSAFFNVS